MDFTPQYMSAQQYSYSPQYPYPIQQPWNAQQLDYGCQGQNQWDMQQPNGSWQPQASWDTQQSCYNGQNTWNTYQPITAGQIQQEPHRLWSGNFGGLIAEDEIVPENMPEAAPETALSDNKQPSKAVNLVLNIATFAFVAFLLAGSTMFAFSNKDTKNLFGYRFYNVLTPSMVPFFKPGDMIFVKLTEPSQVKVGDVVTFNPSTKSDAFLTHRVAELLPADETHPARMVTKGDHNNAADPPVGLSAVIGVHRFTIPIMGKVIDMMRGNLIIVCICFGAVFLLLTVLRAYFAARKEEKKKAAALPPAPAPQSFDIRAF